MVARALRLALGMHEVYEREIRDLPCFEYQTTVVVELYRVDCPACGVKAEKVPQLPSKSPYSKRFEDAVGQACESASARQVARRMGLNAKVVADHRATVQHVHRELLSQCIRLVAHHYPHAEVPHLRVVRHCARAVQRLRQSPDDQADRGLGESQIVGRQRRTAGMRDILRPHHEEVLGLLGDLEQSR